MTLDTMDGKTTTEQPSVTIIQTEESRDSPKGGKWSRVTRKHVIIGVTCAVVVAMVITGVLVGVKFYMDSANELVTRSFEFTKSNGKKVKEDVGTDVKENIVRYHLKDDDSEVTVIEDSNRELQLMKVKQSEGSVCYVATLNSSDTALPQAVLNATSPDETLEKDEKYYDVSESAIKDHSMLGAHGQKLCRNLDVHWVTQTCGPHNETASTGEHNRQKRLCIRYRCYRIYYYMCRRCYYYRYYPYIRCYWRICYRYVYGTCYRCY